MNKPHCTTKTNISWKMFLICFLPSIFLGLQQSNAATYYVSTGGSDGNDGSSVSSPVRTIGNALGRAQSAGDIIYVMTGSYVEVVNISQSGITLSAYPGNTPVIDGQSSLPVGDWATLASISGNNNVMSGFEVRNSNIRGTYIAGNGITVTGYRNTLRQLNVHHTWSNGIQISGDYNTVEDSKVWQAAFSNSINPGSSGWGAGLTANRNNSASAIIRGITSYATLRRNAVFNNWGEGLSCFEADHCTMEDNIVYDNYAANTYLSDATNSLVQRNIIYVSTSPVVVSHGRGIMLADEVASVPRSANNVLINNFIFNTDIGAFSWSYVSSGLTNVLIAYNTIVDGGISTGEGGNIVNSNSQIRNNIIIGNRNGIPGSSGITFSNNAWTSRPSAAASASDVLGDPQVARTGGTGSGALSSAYFKILEGSPVINRAMPLGSVSKDFFQGARDSSPDIGGHEYQTSTPVPTPTATPTATPTPVLPPDTAIISYSASSISARNAQINWTTNVPATGIVYYGVSADNLNMSVAANNLLASQSVLLSGLSSSTKYYFKISAGGSNATSSFTTSSTTNNIASLATAYASSESIYTHQEASKAIDGVIAGWPGDYTREWVTTGEKSGAWLELKWKENHRVSQIVLYDRPNLNDQVTSATITFSNGYRVRVGGLSNSGGPVVINFPPVNTSRVKITITGVSSSTANIGLSEVKVIGY